MTPESLNARAYGDCRGCRELHAPLTFGNLLRLAAKQPITCPNLGSVRPRAYPQKADPPIPYHLRLVVLMLPTRSQREPVPVGAKNALKFQI